MMKHVSPAPGVDLYCGDSSEVLPHLRKQGILANLVLSDPPYGVDYQSLSGHPKLQGDGDAYTTANWSVPAMADLMASDTAIYLFTREDVASIWKDAEVKAGLKVKSSIIWDKVHASGLGDTQTVQRSGCETLLLAHKGRPLLLPWADHGRFYPDEPGKIVQRDNNIWRAAVPRDKWSRQHPTPKPVELMERAILQYTQNGALVVDPFMGISPVGVACIRLGRRYVGVELELQYFELAVERIKCAIEIRDAVRSLYDGDASASAATDTKDS